MRGFENTADGRRIKVGALGWVGFGRGPVMHLVHLRKGGQCHCQWSHYSKLSILTPMLAQVYDSSQFHCDRRKLPTPLPSFLAITVELRD